MKQLYLGLAIHNHQPVGNFPWVFEDAYQKAYAPMVDALMRYPTVRISLHYSGCLIDWLEANHPEFIERLGQLVQRGQVEVMSGGYYEPILPMIPDTDKLGQIEKLNRWVKMTFGTIPTGAWLAERVWEPNLPIFLKRAGIDWTIVDDTHFKMTGLHDQDLFGYYVTEEQGYTIKVFPTSKHLRYAIPWSRVSEVIDYFQYEAIEGDTKIAVMGDDGEKFGLWPHTYDYCWKQGWVERFFRALERNAQWLRTITLGDYVREAAPLGRIYLPTASYAEMMEWALPAEPSYQLTQLTHQLDTDGRQDIIQFMRGGFWRNFLVKYPEINSMQKKMLRVHDKVWHHTHLAPDPPGMENNNPHVPPQAAQTHITAPPVEALEELWKSQCNCPYWHGVFGGSYMTDIRAELYRHMITAENIIDTLAHDDEWTRWQAADFDCDGRAELLTESDRMNLYFDLDHGGCVFEWDWRPGQFNLLSTIARRPEAYHHVLREYENVVVTPGQENEANNVQNIHEIVNVKEPGLSNRLWYDWYERRALIDHFLHPETTFEGYMQAKYGEQGDFVDHPYTYEVKDVDGAIELTLIRDGHVWVGSQWLPFRVTKSGFLRPGSDHITWRYVVTNLSDQATSIRFGVEFNINLLGGGGNDAARFQIPGVYLDNDHLDSLGETPEVSAVGLSNTWLDIGVVLGISKAATLWRFPIETIGNSEAGFERVYQGSSLLLHWQIELGKGESWEVGLSCDCRHASSVL